MDLKRFLSPKSIAIIGGGVWGENVITHSRKLGFSGEIWAVNPKGKDIGGVKAFKSISELPQAPDAAYICVNRNLTIKAVGKLSKISTGGAVCFASGFSEASQEDKNAHQLQQNLVDAAGDMPIIGPNCYGFINYLDRLSLWPDQQGSIARDDGVAIFTQSSNIALNITFVDCALPLSHIITVGNQAQLDMAEIAMGMLFDDRVKAIGLHIEGIKNLENFRELARQAQKALKPVIVLKIGKSNAAKQATFSHTASLAGDYTASSALFERLGFIQTESLPEFIETLKLAYITGPLVNNQISSMSCSGGEASLMGDLAEEHNIQFPPLSDSTKNELRDTLGPMVALANPLDYHTYIWRDEQKLTSIFSAMGKANHAINLLLLDYPRPDRCDDTDWIITENALVKAKNMTGAHFGVVASFHQNLTEARAESLLANGLVPFSGMSEALSAIANMSKNYPHEHCDFTLPLAVHNAKRYEEGSAKEILRNIGLNIPEGRSLDLEGIKINAANLKYPVVLKGEGFAHKSEQGAVILNIQSAEELISHATKMNAGRFLVESMIVNPIAEILIGIRLDMAHGYILTIGAGGIYTEIWQDSKSLLLPIDRETAENALSQLKIAPLLNGYRGKPKADIDTIINTIMKLQDFVLENRGKIAEIEINPLLVSGDFAIVADALLVGDLT